MSPTEYYARGLADILRAHGIMASVTHPSEMRKNTWTVEVGQRKSDALNSNFFDVVLTPYDDHPQVVFFGVGKKTRRIVQNALESVRTEQEGGRQRTTAYRRLAEQGWQAASYGAGRFHWFVVRQLPDGRQEELLNKRGEPRRFATAERARVVAEKANRRS